MADRRLVNPHEVLVEPSNLDKAGNFVTETHELDRLPEPFRFKTVETAARMLTALEVALFDAPPDTLQGISCILAVLDEQTMEDVGDTRVIFARGEKQRVGGVRTGLQWFTAEQFMELGLEQIPE
jgi:hypothetical protein